MLEIPVLMVEMTVGLAGLVASISTARSPLSSPTRTRFPSIESAPMPERPVFTVPLSAGVAGTEISQMRTVLPLKSPTAAMVPSVSTMQPPPRPGLTMTFAGVAGLVKSDTAKLKLLFEPDTTTSISSPPFFCGSVIQFCKMSHKISVCATGIPGPGRLGRHMR